MPRHGMRIALAALYMTVSTQACAPRSVYRPSLPPPDYFSQQPAAPPAATPPAPEAKPVSQPSAVGEEDLRERRRAPPPRPQEPQRTAQTQAAPPVPAARPLPEEASLPAKITPKSSPQRVASLRLVEEGKKLLESGDHAKALSRLEKAITIDSTNPYGYYFLAKAHYSLGRYQESLRFLAVAESLLTTEPYWLSEVFALRGENYRTLGFVERADLNYAQALRLNPGNRVAAEGQSRIQEEARPGSR